MSVTQAILRREFRQTWLMFLLTTLGNIVFLLLLSQRSYRTLESGHPLIVTFVFAAILVYLRVYHVHQHGTWLLLPVSRFQNAAARAGFLIALLAIQTLIASLALFAWVRTSDAPGGPIPPFGSAVFHGQPQQLAASAAIVFSLWVASLMDALWRRVVWIVAGFGWIGLPFSHYELVQGYTGSLAPDWSTWSFAALVLTLCVGFPLILQETRFFGHSPRTLLDILRAFWLAPTFALGLSVVVAVLSLDRRPPAKQWKESAVLADARVVVLDVERGQGGVGRSWQGKPLYAPLPGELADASLVELSSLASIVKGRQWPDPIRVDSDGDGLFVSEDKRHVLIFEQDSGRQIGCWGEDGVVVGPILHSISQ